MSGKLAHVIYGCLKSSRLYDPKVQAQACSLPWDDSFVKIVTGSAEEHAADAKELADREDS